MISARAPTRLPHSRKAESMCERKKLCTVSDRPATTERRCSTVGLELPEQASTQFRGTEGKASLAFLKRHYDGCDCGGRRGCGKRGGSPCPASARRDREREKRSESPATNRTPS